MAKKEEQLAMPKDTENSAITPSAIPSFMQPYAGKGLDNITPDDLEIPRLKLLQALSPEITDFDGAKPGVFWHTLLDESLGKQLKIVPVWIDLSYILWKPRHMGGGILARAADGIHWVPDNASFNVQPKKDSNHTVVWKTAKTVASSGLDEWGSSDPSDSSSQPAATKMYNVVVVMPYVDRALSPAVVTLQRSAITVARKFMGKLKISSVPSFGQYYTMESFQDSSNLGEFFNFKFTKAGLVMDEAAFNDYRATYEAFQKMGLKIRDVEKLQDDTEPVTSDKF